LTHPCHSCLVLSFLYRASRCSSICFEYFFQSRLRFKAKRHFNWRDCSLPIVRPLLHQTAMISHRIEYSSAAFVFLARFSRRVSSSVYLRPSIVLQRRLSPSITCACSMPICFFAPRNSCIVSDLKPTSSWSSRRWNMSASMDSRSLAPAM